MSVALKLSDQVSSPFESYFGRRMITPRDSERILSPEEVSGGNILRNVDPEMYDFYTEMEDSMPEDLTIDNPTLRGVVEMNGVQVNLMSFNLFETAIRSFKGTGAFRAMEKLKEQGVTEVVTCSAGNHAQGVAYAAAILGIKAHIYMPEGTSKAKVKATEDFGGNWVEVHLVGEAYNDAADAASMHSKENTLPMVPPFDDLDVIDGQGLHMFKLLKFFESTRSQLDLVLAEGGGGGLLAGTKKVRSSLSPDTTIVGVEGEGSDCVAQALKNNGPIALSVIDPYAQGMAVKKCGKKTYEVIRDNTKEGDFFVTVNNGQIAQAVKGFSDKNETVETAGATATAAFLTPEVLAYLDRATKGAKEQGKTQLNVVSFVSGGNITAEELVQRKLEADVYSEVRRYYEVELPQNEAGILREVTTYLKENGINICNLNYATNEFQTDDKRPLVELGVEVTDDPSVLDRFEDWLKARGNRSNDVSREHVSKVASVMREKEDQFEKKASAVGAGYTEVQLKIPQQAGALHKILQIFEQQGVNVEHYKYNMVNPEAPTGVIEIGMNQQGKLLSEEVVRNMLGQEYEVLSIKDVPGKVRYIVVSWFKRQVSKVLAA